MGEVKFGKLHNMLVISTGIGWYRWTEGENWRFVGPSDMKVEEISKTEFVLATGTSPERFSVGLDDFSELHQRICRRRDELFRQLAADKIEEVTEKDILGEHKNGKESQ